MNEVPFTYADTLHKLLDQFETAAWQAWWEAGADEVLEIEYGFMEGRTGVTVRHARGRWKATIHRAGSTFTGFVDPAELARKDVQALLEAVRRRTGHGEAPPL